MLHTRRAFIASAIGLAATARSGFGQQKRVRTLLGNGTAGSQQEASDAAQALVNNPYGVVIGPDAALYFCEVDTGRTRRLDLGARRLTTIAGNGQKAYAGDGGPALAASFSAPHEIRFDAGRNLFIVERDAHVVRRVDAKTGVVSTVAGTGTAGFSGDGGPATRAELRQPHSIAFDAAGQSARLRHRQSAHPRSQHEDRRDLHVRGNRRAPRDARRGAARRHAAQRTASIDTDPEGNVYLVLREGNAVFRIDGAFPAPDAHRRHRRDRLFRRRRAGHRRDTSTDPKASPTRPIAVSTSSTPRTTSSAASTCEAARSPRSSARASVAMGRTAIRSGARWPARTACSSLAACFT